MPENNTLAFDSQFSDVLVNALADRRVGRVTLEVLGDFAACADEYGWCWPKVKNLATRRGMTVKAYSKHVGKLKTLGYLFRGMRHDHGGFWWLVANTQSEVAFTQSVPSRLPGRLLYSTCIGTTPPLDAGEEEPQMNYLDLRELEGASDVSENHSHPKAKPAVRPKTGPPKLNAYALAEKFGWLYRRHYPVLPPPSRAMLGRSFSHWHREGVRYEVIDFAIDIFFDSVRGTLVAPADKVFIKQRFRWIDQANEGYYRDVELPAIQKSYNKRLEAFYDELQVKLAAVAPHIPFTPSTAQKILAAVGVEYPVWNG